MQKTTADFLSALELTKNNLSSKIYTHNIGRIIQFYPATQTADVELMQVKEYNGQLYPSTVLSKIPVIVYGSKDAQITLPDLTGTICVILTFDRNISAFMKTGESYEAKTSRKHNITDSIALTTFFSLNKSIQNYDNHAITITFQNGNIKVKDELISNSQGDITINSPTKIILNAPDVETTGNLNVATGYTGVVPCGAATLQITNGIVTGVS